MFRQNVGNITNMVDSEVEIPTATEIPITIVIAEPIAQTTRPKWKIPFCVPICGVSLAMFLFLIFVFWNQRH